MLEYLSPRATCVVPPSTIWNIYHFVQLAWCLLAQFGIFITLCNFPGAS
jgi:hypothetical protein